MRLPTLTLIADTARPLLSPMLGRQIDKARSTNTQTSSGLSAGTMLGPTNLSATITYDYLGSGLALLTALGLTGNSRATIRDSAPVYDNSVPTHFLKVQGGRSFEARVHLGTYATGQQVSIGFAKNHYCPVNAFPTYLAYENAACFTESGGFWRPVLANSYANPATPCDTIHVFGPTTTASVTIPHTLRVVSGPNCKHVSFYIDDQHVWTTADPTGIPTAEADTGSFSCVQIRTRNIQAVDTQMFVGTTTSYMFPLSCTRYRMSV